MVSLNLQSKLNWASGGLVSAINDLELVNFVSLVLSYHMWRLGGQRAPEFCYYANFVEYKLI